MLAHCGARLLRGTKFAHRARQMHAPLFVFMPAHNVADACELNPFVFPTIGVQRARIMTDMQRQLSADKLPSKPIKRKGTYDMTVAIIGGTQYCLRGRINLETVDGQTVVHKKTVRKTGLKFQINQVEFIYMHTYLQLLPRELGISRACILEVDPITKGENLLWVERNDAYWAENVHPRLLGFFRELHECLLSDSKKRRGRSSTVQSSLS